MGTFKVRSHLKKAFANAACMADSEVLWIALLAIFLASCGDVVQPTNLEPVIKNLNVSEVTRSSAKLTAEIELHGSGYFDSFHFEYSAGAGINISSEEIENPSGKVEVVLTGLQPGTSYTFKGVGIRNTVVVESETVCFETDPNERPRVSALSTVSAGPTAIIVKFDIVSDGGDRITDSGCYIGKANDALTLKVKSESLPAENTTNYILINSLDTLTEYVIYPYAENHIGETVGEAFHFTTADAIVLNRAGDMDKILTDIYLENKALTISGYMNGDDFNYIRNRLSSSIKSLDIADVSIVEGGGCYDGSRFTKKDVVTTGLLADYSVLESVILPNAATAIERNSFSGNASLKSLTIPAKISAIIPSADCRSLSWLSVSEANHSFKEFDGVIYDHSLSDLVWYPEARTGKLTLPPTLSEIGQSAFAHAKIEYISLPENLKEIGRCAFEGSLLREITIPDNVRNVSEGLLQNCPQLKSVVLGKSVEFVGNYVFDNSPVEDIYVLSPYPPYVTSDTFGGNLSLYENCSIHVPQGSRELYRHHAVWGLFNNIND